MEPILVILAVLAVALIAGTFSSRRFRDRLAKARSTFAGFLGRTRIDEETWDELEEALIRADLGVGPTTELLDQLRPG
jgi:signal recognition particle GTPase